VAGFAADPDNVTRWYANIKSVEWLSPPPLHVGSRLSFVASFLGAEAGLHVRGSRACTRVEADDEHEGGAVSDGDLLLVGGHLRWDADDAAQPR
jgi:hypothetical protein